MDILNQYSLPDLLSSAFAIIGFLLIIILLLSRATLFFIMTFTKKKVGSIRKSFFIPIIGVLFIISLAINANNAFIYAIAIIIIATLITELEFLEKLMALLWNRPAYWQYQELLIATKSPQQSVVESSKDKKELEGLDKKLEKGEEDNPAPISSSDTLLLSYHSEKIYRLIFGTQLGILQLLNIADINGITKQNIYETYMINPISVSYPFESYMGFLESNQLIKLIYSSSTYHITPFGKFFLQYLENNQIPPIRPN